MILQNTQTVFIFWAAHLLVCPLTPRQGTISPSLIIFAFHPDTHMHTQTCSQSTCTDKLSLSAAVTTGAQTVVSTRLGRRGWWPTMSELPRGTGADQRRHTGFFTFLLIYRKTGQGKVIWHHYAALSFSALLISVTWSETSSSPIKRRQGDKRNLTFQPSAFNNQFLLITSPFLTL